MSILIREGSAAKNYKALKPLIASHPNRVMFCTDDSHPDELINLGEIDKIVKMAIADGYDIFDVLNAASINAINHYKLDVGQLRVGDNADFIVVESIKNFEVVKVFIDGQLKYDVNSDLELSRSNVELENNFTLDKISLESLHKSVTKPTIAISLMKDEIITESYLYTPKSPIENLEYDPQCDLAKIVYINRYKNGDPKVAFCRGFGIKRGAFASSIAHDSHNIIAIGANDADLQSAINAVIESKGGLSICDGGIIDQLPLPIGGIMNDWSAMEVDMKYKELNDKIHQLGSMVGSPYMTLSFLSLVVIGEVKIGEKGLFSYSSFDWI